MNGYMILASYFHYRRGGCYVCKKCSDSSCTKESCSNCSKAKVDFSVAPHPLSHVKKVIGVVSGKGGVGKSMVTSLSAVAMQKAGYKTGILDADITGPSIPKAFGIEERAFGNEEGIVPVKSKGGIDVMSVNLLLQNPTDPVNLARTGHCQHGKAVLERCGMGRCGLSFCGYAARNR